MLGLKLPRTPVIREKRVRAIRTNEIGELNRPMMLP